MVKENGRRDGRQTRLTGDTGEASVKQSCRARSRRPRPRRHRQRPALVSAADAAKRETDVRNSPEFVI
ncbi:hypothetical protein EVAR_20430_1 [Eumeta japonica]|uniref:Uncharacterized protein n=1 Tax=Eumeta variegata TaxID=151549 RepID=A0A4C1TYA0_EUMVA|nr:hypothetical protein EVAR_20430_1 [Eumeta japonica]